jgi:hypothetical protein
VSQSAVFAVTELINAEYELAAFDSALPSNNSLERTRER